MVEPRRFGRFTVVSQIAITTHSRVWEATDPNEEHMRIETDRERERYGGSPDSCLPPRRANRGGDRYPYCTRCFERVGWRGSASPTRASLDHLRVLLPALDVI